MGRPSGSLVAAEVSASERLFLAVALDDEARHRLAASLDGFLAGRTLPGRIVPIANWHITLRFLGESSELDRELVLGRLSEQLDEEPFSLTLGRLGTFPRPHRASVVWVGVEDATGAMARLAAVCEDVAQSVGFSPEERPFRPHLTISRLRPPGDVESLVSEAQFSTVRLQADALTMYRSVSTPSGQHYEVVERLVL